jgi:hypothetical protein
VGFEGCEIVPVAFGSLGPCQPRARFNTLPPGPSLFQRPEFSFIVMSELTFDAHTG